MKLAHVVGIGGSLLLLTFGAVVVLDLLDRHAEWSEAKSYAAVIRESDSLKVEVDIARRQVNAMAARLAAIERACRRRGG